MKIKIDRLKNFIKKYYKLIIIFICLILTLEIVYDLFEKEVMLKDVLGYKFVSKYLISDTTIPIAKFITNFGGIVWLITLAIVLFIILAINKNKLMGFFIILNLAISGALNQILKHIVQRPRPTEYRLIDESGYSFPSGHSMVSAAFYGLFIYLVFKNVKNKYIKWKSIVLLIIFIIAIGVSRIFLGVHYTSDVLAGFLISISYLVIYTSIINDYPDEGKKEDTKDIKKDIK